MRKLHFVYDMCLEFSEPVFKHEYTLKCFPQSDEIQQIRAMTVGIEPRGKQFASSDSFGNRTICGSVPQRHSRFEVNVEGDAASGTSAARPASQSTLGTFRYPSQLTAPGDLIAEYIKEHDFSGGNLDTARFYMELVNRDLSYVPGITDVNTTAEAALSLKKGVCQDYAHVMIALLRQKRIPARYVCGMMEGEGASHAWVEVEQDGLWYGFDPTNAREIGDSYIHISCGRDAADCGMNRGVFTGGGKQEQSVKVVVAAI